MKRLFNWLFGCRPVQFVTEKYEPHELDIKLGTLEIKKECIGADCFLTGVGTKIYYNGEEMKSVRSLTLRISGDSVTTLTVERLVTGIPQAPEGYPSDLTPP